ncbi:MarR family transcriptional regulator [uncultured Sphingomonas sp.]|uniref:MarR family winged helix-turn-helix transcriptional regulator n=1 Tax=uncultured Sphingomonas sp. TaxID=158754 RepID=UPI0025CC3B4F|nr:MarR family transcriptional regulator [uncultured Sphingomonas sp.]
MTKVDPDLQRRLGARLVPLARSYRRALDRGMADLSLSHSMALAVMLLGRLGDGVRQGALAEQMGMEAASVVPLVDQMERAGLVARQVDASDKRARTLHLTEAGSDLAARAETRSARIRAALLDGISEADLRTALSVLDRLNDAIGAGGQD